jgi:hypothetical protein
MPEFIYLINQNGNPAKTTPEIWANVRAIQPNAKEITEAEYNKLTNPDFVDVEVTEQETQETETTTVEQENITTVEEVEEILNLDEYNKAVLIHAIYVINPTATFTIGDKKAVLIAELQKFSDAEVKSAIDSYVVPFEPDTAIEEVVEAVTEI